MDNGYQYDCSICTERCDGVSKGNYNFKNDIELSEYYEKELIRRIKEEGCDKRKALPDCEMKIQVHRNSNDHDWKYKMDMWNFHSWWRKVKTTNERRANADPEISMHVVQKTMDDQMDKCKRIILNYGNKA